MESIYLETEHTEIMIKNWDWHRGSIFLPSGVINLKNIPIDNILEKVKVDKNMLLDFFDYMEIYGKRKFGSSYVEFLYPGSPDYGQHVHIKWFNFKYDDIECFLIDYEDWNKTKIENKEEVIEELAKLEDILNNYLVEAEKKIYDYIEEIQNESYVEVIEE